jgi:ectoine hydroxylase-related dioxygenase (phytanoyl-CoA dioxygenase family)
MVRSACQVVRSQRAQAMIYILPRDITQDTSVAVHEWEENGSNLIGYRGAERGEIIEVPAGSIVAFSSLTMHRTGGNSTDNPRRALVCQYSVAPLLRPDTGRPQNRAVRVPLRLV